MIREKFTYGCQVNSTKARHKGPGRDATSAKALATAQRHAEWFELRLKGLTYRAIGELHGVAHGAVEEAIRRRLRDTIAEPANELRVVELERLDRLLMAVWSAATGDMAERIMASVEELLAGDEPNPEALQPAIDAVARAQLLAVEGARKLLADRRRMLGLDAPIKVEPVASQVIELEELRRLLNSMGYDIVPLPPERKQPG